MKIKVIAVGKLKEKYTKEAVDEYISGDDTTVAPAAKIQLRSGEGAYLVVHEISSTCGQ